MSEALSATNALNLGYLEVLYAQFMEDPASVPEDAQAYFSSIQGNGENRSFRSGPSFSTPGLFRSSSAAAGVSGDSLILSLQHKVGLLIRNFRVRGHRRARLNPLNEELPDIPEIDPSYYGLTEEHMNLPFATTYLAGGGTPKLGDIVTSLRNTYCRSIGVQFMHIDALEVRVWLEERMERSENRLELNREEQRRIFTRLTDAVIFEDFIQKKYVGAKSFSLEGAETLIPLLGFAIDEAAEDGIEEILIGMPHRGRLNVLANILGKDAQQIFREFEDKDPVANLGRGDVTSHLGHHTDWLTSAGKQVHLSLAFNPSHLEFVNVVTQGRKRATNDRIGDKVGSRGMVFLMHGDAAFAGEGIVQETLNLSQLEGYSTGGTLHIVVNNSIGFTTLPEQSRSTTYATDVAKMLQIPIFHVNGEDPEAVTQVVNLALEFRKEFQRDVVIDMYCFRRRGHNEGDEPGFTQPILYKAIGARKSVRDSYLSYLINLGGLTEAEADDIAAKRRDALEQALALARTEKTAGVLMGLESGPAHGGHMTKSLLQEIWSKYRYGSDLETAEAKTSVDRKVLSGLLKKLTDLPETFTPNPKIRRFLENRRDMADGKRALDWSAGEALAIASLAVEGIHVRYSGQDSERGTFSHRHAVLHDVETNETYCSLQHLSGDQAAVDIINSPLSESGVLGFEYGYSAGYPDGLVVWEAQFGDFANVAQVYIDQFISTAEDKWNRPTGIVMLLPHGLEGTGPEHASARLERFLQIAAEDNMQIVNLSTPAQIFHCLRRQVLRLWRKPLIVMAPKSMLRHPKAVSSLEDLSGGQFEYIIPDTSMNPKKVRRVLFCCGKIYYDLLERRTKEGIEDIAIVRLEQLYPIKDALVEETLAPYKKGTPVFWVQEEPKNMGAWIYLQEKFGANLLDKYPFKGIYRAASASPATGSAASHRHEQQELLALAMDRAVPTK
jgi:2-oxoglutarate dehydrogenase E1 component